MNCDYIAQLYRWLEYLVFGRTLERCRNHFLTATRTGTSALLLGDGDGRFLKNLLLTNPDVIVDSVDSSGKMLALARQRTTSVPGAAARTRFLHADARSPVLDHEYDLIVTHFFLDCLTEAEIQSLATRLQEHSAGQTRWIISEFQIPPRGPLRFPAKVLIRLMYFCFRLATGLKVQKLPDHRSILQQTGFRLASERLICGGILVSELWETRLVSEQD